MAVKIFTNLGPVIISTAYFPPHNLFTALDFCKLTKFKLPLLIFGDFNSKHPFFHNENTNYPSGNTNGRTMYNLCIKNNLQFLGPTFNTFITKYHKSKLDIAICNQDFNIFHNKFEHGETIGSDHIPVILKLSSKPIKTLINPKQNLDKLNIEQYKEDLKEVEPFNFQDQPIDQIDKQLDNFIKSIKIATRNNSPILSIVYSQTYQPTALIVRKLKQYQSAWLNYIRHGMPRLDKLRRMKNNLGELIKEANTESWNKITELICQHWGDPKTFWWKYKELKGNKSKPPKYLILIFGDPSNIEPDQIDHCNKQLIYTNPEK